MVPRTGERPPRLSRSVIEEAVLEVGFAHVSTTVVARHLGVDQSSLYRHIRSRDELIMGAVDRVLQAQPWPDIDNRWECYVHDMALCLWQMLRAHPGMATVMLAMQGFPPRAGALLNEGVAAFVADGWNMEDAVLLLDSVADMTLYTVLQTEHMEQSRKQAESEGRPFPSTPALSPPAETDPSSPVMGFAEQVVAGDPQIWWRRKLDLLLAGGRQLLTDTAEDR